MCEHTKMLIGPSFPQQSQFTAQAPLSAGPHLKTRLEPRLRWRLPSLRTPSVATVASPGSAPPRRYGSQCERFSCL